MIDDKIRTNVDGRSEQAKPDQVVQQTQQTQASGVTHPDRRTVTGRRPLFRK
jgi:hypothetical protein